MLQLPYLTSDLAPIGGRIKERIEDFLVEELPLYPPSGQGEHIYLFVEKKNLSTMQMVHALSRHFNVKRDAVGFAGMKDKFAITRQVVSIHAPGKTADDFPMIRNDRITVLWADQHVNKLRLGHLAGNRFSIRIRGVRMTDVLRANQVLQRLARQGVPNFAGEQRFGNRLNNHRLGRAMILRDWRGLLDELLGPDPDFPHLNHDARAAYARGEFSAALDAFPVACRHERIALHVLETGGSPEKAVRAIDFAQRKFWFTSLQSWIFNHCLAQRMAAGNFDRFVEGDLAMKLDNGALFAVTAQDLADPTLAQRLERFEISPTGPLWGSKVMRAAHRAGDDELRALRDAGLTPEALEEAARQLGHAMTGDRRPNRIPLRFPEIEAGMDEHGEYVRCAFELPPGAFATVVMREIMKNDAITEPEAETD
ncbi:MAG: tRNA pseudouridine(13) synthase TruD [Phycisphaerae bacterium]|nr:tRNA pseudouridine(13) synthase TruD [Phycisphaerae bacterium]